MRITPSLAYFLLQCNPPLNKKEIAYLQFTVRRVPPKEMMERLFFEDITSVYQIDKRVEKLCKDFLPQINSLQKN